MALINCPDCNAQVSDRAPACLKCGRPVGGNVTQLVRDADSQFESREASPISRGWANNWTSITGSNSVLSSSNPCPHCHTDVPRGARVCTGCQAEVEYGPPSAAFGLLVLASAFFSYQVGQPVGWWLFLGMLVIGSVSLTKLYAKRVVFKRGYRWTK